MKISKCQTSDGTYYFSAPLVVNIQLSNYCPLKCPFCFMPQNERRDMPMTMLTSLLKELSDIGCRTILYGQGEPMVSGDILKAVELAHNASFNVRIATSGAGCTYNKLRRLYELGLTELHVSINSFNRSVNQSTRVGYDLAVNTLKLATSLGIRTKLNYVAQSDTIDMFPEYIQHAMNYHVDGINILREKVNRHGEIGKYTKEDLDKLAQHIKNSDIPIEIEECFCELKLYLPEHKKSALQGCSAGKAMMAIGSDGRYFPCSHLPSKAESFSCVKDYWTCSETLMKLREVHLTEEPCRNCINVDRCTPCQAIYRDDKHSYHKSRVDCSSFMRKDG